MVIVELYDTVEEAQAGHDRWVETMLSNPPSVLEDVSTSASATILREMGELPPRERKMNNEQ
jgi:hypothetical protein